MERNGREDELNELTKEFQTSVNVDHGNIKNKQSHNRGRSGQEEKVPSSGFGYTDGNCRMTSTLLR